MNKIAFVLLFAAALLGCSHYDFDLSSGEPEWGSGPVKDESADSQQRTQKLAQALAARQESRPSEASEYVIGPGDVLAVNIFSLGSPGQVTPLNRTVSQSGHISLPWVGEVAAAGLSTPQLEERLKEAYGGNYLKHPQLTVNVAEYHSVPVVVTGAVEKPGLYCLTSNRSTVLECLALAGGLKSTAADELLIIRGGESPSPAVSPGGSSLTQAAGKAGQPSAGQAQDTVPVDLKQLVEQGNMLMNLPVKAGDVLIVPSRARRYIYVLGYVNRPGAYELDEGSQMDALRAVAMGGGLAGIARPSNSFLIRETPPRGQTAIPVDLEEVARGVLPPLRLQPGDTLVVGTTAFGRMSQFIAPSMGATFSASASVAK